MQELTHYYQNVFTLKSGEQIEINTKEKKDSVSGKVKVDFWKIVGFIKTPLLEEKTVLIVQKEIAAIEVTKKGCIAQVIPWPEDGIGPLKCDHPADATCGECVPHKVDKSVEDMTTKELIES